MGHTVQETNDNCTVSKYSMVTQGYFHDDYVKYMAPKSKRRCPLINIGYCVRAHVMEESLLFFLNETKNVNSQIISLGAGFDTTYFRLASNFENVTYFEMDLKDVVDLKIKRIKESNCLTKKLKNMREHLNGLLSENYILIAQDMSNMDGLREVLSSVGMKTDKPTLFLSECAITYMREEKSRAIINWASSFPDVVFLIYEQIYPDDGYSQAMLKHYDNLSLPLWSVEVYRSKEDQINRYQSCGFERAWSIGAFDIFKKVLNSEGHERVLSIEPFDEWEEWHLTSSHYTLSIGTKGLFNRLFSTFVSPYTDNEDNSGAVSTSCAWELLKNVSIQFFGHSSVEIWEGHAILVIGGFGLSQENKHMRLSQLCLISLPDLEVTYITPPSIEGLCWDCVYHTCSILSDSRDATGVLLYGGRMSPSKSSNKSAFRITFSMDTNGQVIITGRRTKINILEPHPRRRHTATKVEDSTMIFGGIWTDPDSKQQKIFDDAWLLTKEENWVELTKKPPSRFSHSATSRNEIVFIVGGIGNTSNSYGSLSDVWSYNLSDNLWTKFEMDIIPRYSHTCHIIDDNLFLVGGVNELSERQPGFTVINLETLNIWEFKLPGSSRDLPIMLHSHTSVVCQDRTGILVIGGGGHCFSFGTYFNKHPVRFSTQVLGR